MRNKLIIAFILFAGLYSAQQNLHQRVSELIIKAYPNLGIDSKLMIINFDKNSGKINNALYSELEKTASVYQVAKLKGGKKGLVCVTIIPDTQTEIAIDKEGYKKIIKIKWADLGSMDNEALTNIAYDSKGEIVFKNINEKDIYGSVQKLITR